MIMCEGCQTKTFLAVNLTHLLPAPNFGSQTEHCIKGPFVAYSHFGSYSVLMTNLLVYKTESSRSVSNEKQTGSETWWTTCCHNRILSAQAYLILSLVRLSQRDLKLSRSPVNTCTSASALAALASDLQPAKASACLDCFRFNHA